MPRVLAISSYVARGHVGLAAIVPALQRLGHEVVALPTVILSNHLGHAHAAGMTVPPDTLTHMIEAYRASGWLADIDAILTGYLPTAAHVDLAGETVSQVRRLRPDLLFVVDPVLGDDPEGLYVDSAAAAAVRDQLLPMADILTPNRFELAWLSGGPAETAAEAVAAARSLPSETVLLTSLPADDDRLESVLVDRGGVWTGSVPRLDQVPHGTGDLFAALFVGHRLHGLALPEALGAALAATAAVAAASVGLDELNLVELEESWSRLQPIAIEPIGP